MKIIINYNLVFNKKITKTLKYNKLFNNHKIIICNLVLKN